MSLAVSRHSFQDEIFCYSFLLNFIILQILKHYGCGGLQARSKMGRNGEMSGIQMHDVKFTRYQ